MIRYKANVDYHGRNFSGWQIQPDARTVQDEIQKAISIYTKKETPIVGCGRTDAGVHAKNYVFHFDSISYLSQMDLKGINAILPEDIAISNLMATEPDFHARYSCYRRTYQYFIHFDKSVFSQGQSFHYPIARQIDLSDLNKAAKLMIGERSFGTFCKSNSGVENFKCNVDMCHWEQIDNGLVLTISSNRFLRGMVRLTVGMCLSVALGKLSYQHVENAINNENRLDKPWSVPAEGLFLVQVEYP